MRGAVMTFLGEECWLYVTEVFAKKYKIIYIWTTVANSGLISSPIHTFELSRMAIEVLDEKVRWPSVD